MPVNRFSSIMFEISSDLPPARTGAVAQRDTLQQ